MRAREPDQQGFVVRDGVKVAYEVFGDGPRTLVFLPSWVIAHSRMWKAQVAYLARHMRVLTIDGRGNGLSDRPSEAAQYEDREYAADALAVMDAVGAARATIVSHSSGSYWHLILAGEHPERVDGSIFFAPSLPLAPRHAGRDINFNAHHPDNEGWHKFNRHSWMVDFRGFLEFFFGHLFTEPHSTKQIEDCVGWALETTPETLIKTLEAPSLSLDQVKNLCTRIKGPVMVIHGSEDSLVPLARGAAAAEATGGRLVTLEGGGHGVYARDPVKSNLLLREFVAPRAPAAILSRALGRKKRALFISSPIGLGHAQRDIAIADELRKLHPGLEIDWLAQNPVTRVLEARGECIHPASEFLASDSAHIESEAQEHDLHCFQAWRRMDEIMVANFMVFHDVVQDHRYDLWVGDEAWEIDYFLHENPEEKRAPIRTYGSRTSSVGCRCPTAARRRSTHGGLQRRDDRADRTLSART